VSLIDNHSIAVIILNTFDTSLSSSFFDSASSFFNENLFSQITTIILQNFFERARREVRQQVKNVYSYDSIINQIVKSFFNDALSARTFNHLLFYLSSTINIQTSTSTIKDVKQRRDADRSRDRLRESDAAKESSRTWIILSLLLFRQWSTSRR
jgi:hypothetical protein